MSLNAEQIECLVVAVLSVNKWEPSRAWALLPQLRSQQLTDAQVVARQNIEETSKRLVAAGYARGGITPIVARRLQSLMSAIGMGLLDDVPSALFSGQWQTAEAKLRSVRGVGPSVAGTALELLKATSKP